jgi:small-conductance mechanosensitive channel
MTDELRIQALQASLDQANMQIIEQREVIEQALEALEQVTRHFTRTPSTLADTEARGKAHKTIDALREVLGSEE